MPTAGPFLATCAGSSSTAARDKDVTRALARARPTASDQCRLASHLCGGTMKMSHFARHGRLARAAIKKAESPVNLRVVRRFSIGFPHRAVHPGHALPAFFLSLP